MNKPAKSPRPLRGTFSFNGQEYEFSTDVHFISKTNREFVERFIRESLNSGKSPDKLVENLKSVNEQDLRYMW